MAASGSCGTGMTWVLADNGTLTISGNGAISFTTQPWINYVDLITTIVIEEGVTSICKECFKDLSSVEEVHFPSTVTSVLDNAFTGCKKIERLYVVDIAKYVEKVSFSTVGSRPHYVSSTGVDLYVNESLVTTLVIPNGVKNITDYSINNIKSIQDVSFPDTLLSLGARAFEKCSSLERVELPNSVTNLGGFSFQDCPNLKEIFLGDGVTSLNVSFGTGLTSLKKLVIGSGYNQNNPAYYLNQCETITDVIVSENNTTYTMVDGLMYTKDLLTVVYIPLSKIESELLDSVTTLGSSLYLNRTCINEYTIPESIITISNSCFKGCANLTEINIPKNIGELSYGCFEECTSLTEVTVNGYIPPKTYNDSSFGILRSAFKGCTSLTAIKVPIGTGETYKAADGWSSYASLIIESEEAGYDVPPVDPEPDLPVEPDIPTFDYTSMILGWLVGRRMRVLRSAGSQNGS